MPGHRRDDDPDDATRSVDAVPSAARTSGDVHGSTAVTGPATGAGSTPEPRDGDTLRDQPTVVTSTAGPSAGHTAVQPAVASPTAVRDDRTPTTPVAAGPPPDRTAVTPAAVAPAGPPAPGGPPPAPASQAGRKEVVAAQRAQYGGISWGSAFFGWLSANGMAVLLIALLSALGVALGLTSRLDDPAQATEQAASGTGLGAGIAVLVALFLAYLAGGYVAGRMARFDGAKQGLAVWVIGLLVVLLLALAGLVFGSQYNVLAQLDLPRIPIDEGTATTAGIIALAAILVVTLVAAVLGGLLGARYHRKVDRVGFDH